MLSNKTIIENKYLVFNKILITDKSYFFRNKLIDNNTYIECNTDSLKKAIYKFIDRRPIEEINRIKGYKIYSNN